MILQLEVPNKYVDHKNREADKDVSKYIGERDGNAKNFRALVAADRKARMDPRYRGGAK